MRNRFRTLILSAKRNKKNLPRFSVSRACVLRKLRLLRGLFLSILHGRFSNLICNRLRCIMSVRIIRLRFRHIHLRTFTITKFTFRCGIYRRLRLRHSNTFALTFLTATTFTIRTRMSNAMSRLLNGQLIHP